ncbi:MULTISPECIES: FtsX-like permease family protein [unclassified Rhodanobacter]|uniref:ABC transporter permease n=1 Tax=unclassified Rhodanobacter TaxID=2621553 RepID=UPI001BE062F9|nr:MULTISPECIES: FtsX-like permease family protein [unclassified Rhodanobacter]MBT2145712.1 ABC transporter permease [Rhodanobacter sp. LX-99]MBT2149791.1 ABC transporter permease [Rhodanobacter sp. LX-100]
MALTRTFMQLRPIVAALGRHKVATALIVLQVALTLAVASNAMFIVATRIVHLSRPTSTDEAHLFVIRNGWKMGQTAAQINANIRADLDTLRNVAGVHDVFSSQGFPLEGYNVDIVTHLKLDPDQKTNAQLVTFFASDEHAIDTLGISLVAGRNFRPDEITAIGPNDKMSPSGIIITRSLADKLFPDGSALGKTVYLPGGPAAIIGIVASLQGPLKNSRTMDGFTVLVPMHFVDPVGVVYMVRTDSTDMKPVIAASLKALQMRGGIRIIAPKGGAVTMAQVRERAYADDRSVAMLMSIVCGLLLLATAGGIVGLSSFWVGQRRRQIGIRRSLGATAGDILGYFHTENFLIVSGGIVLGALLAFLANLGLMHVYELPRMPLYVPALGALLLWLLGQLAVWGPARYAAKVPPVVAIRTE